MNKITFGFIVGGDDIYYTNLMRACESLERVKQPHEILIIDMDDRLKIDDPNIKIVNAAAEKVENEDDRNYFQPYIWKKRYEQIYLKRKFRNGKGSNPIKSLVEGSPSDIVNSDLYHDKSFYFSKKEVDQILPIILDTAKKMKIDPKDPKHKTMRMTVIELEI